MNSLSEGDRKSVFDQVRSLAPDGYLNKDQGRFYFAQMDQRSRGKKFWISVIEQNFKNGLFNEAIRGVESLRSRFSLDKEELPKLGKVVLGSNEALRILKAAQDEFKEKNYEKAERLACQILINWPDQKEAKDLIKLAREAKTPRFSQPETPHYDEETLAFLNNIALKKIIRKEPSQNRDSPKLWFKREGIISDEWLPRKKLKVSEKEKNSNSLESCAQVIPLHLPRESACEIRQNPISLTQFKESQKSDPPELESPQNLEDSLPSFQSDLKALLAEDLSSLIDSIKDFEDL